MKRVLSTAFAAVMVFALNGAMISDAEARRLGGGASAGMKRDSSIMRRDAAPAQNSTATPAQAAKPAPNAAPAPAAQPASKSRWLGPIAGLAAGLGIAALLSHFGLGEGFANIVMIMLLAMAAMFVIRMIFARKQAPNDMQYAGAGNAPGYPNAMQYQAAGETGGSAAGNVATIPADFDTASLLRQAKLTFVRLQAANDRGDMADIRNFTAPELFAEIQMQYEERGRSRQQTDVVQLDADLLDVSSEGGNEIASVRFHGQIREVANTSPEHFNEVWHLVRPRDGATGWIVAGIQQAE